MNSDSSRILDNMTSFQLATDEDSRRDFREALLRELESGNLLREEKMFVLDGLVTDWLISGDPSVRDHLNEWSLHALALGPELPRFLAAAGLGRYEAAKALLESLVAAHQSESFDSLMNQAFLARAERALGDPEAARRLANAARSTSNALQAAPRMTAMLSRLEAQ
jgi:hypothetical protein